MEKLKLNRHPDFNDSGHIEQKEQVKKNVMLLYRENDQYNKIIPGVISNLTAQGYKIELQTIPRFTSEENAKLFALKVLENKKDQLVFSDATCTVSDEQISLNEVLNNSNEIENLNKDAEGNAKILVGFFEQLKSLGFNFKRVIIFGSNLADHLENSSKWQKAAGSPEELLAKRILDDNNAAESLKNLFQEKGVAVEIIPSRESDYTQGVSEIMPDKYHKIISEHIGDVNEQEDLIITDSHFISRYNVYDLVPKVEPEDSWGDDEPYYQIPLKIYNETGVNFLDDNKQATFRDEKKKENSRVERFTNLLKEKIESK